ncbi:MAG: 23S rRNA (uracil(1939)-C(5))-methyltransferase RlmD [Desulfobacteraceae bacterium]|nr:MAG: 23S rRNA (uracil(1939)-C(5))-methyltransferase RlmD [Desulfobacteraceae bacterium]
MNMKKRKAYELEIIDLAFGGKGLAKPDGFPVFVDNCLPGDLAFVKITKKKKSWAEGKLIRLIRPSKMRQNAKCAYARYCGGCKWQELPYEQQLEFKQEHVEQTLRHIGSLKDVPVKPVLPSSRIFEYRNKMEFSCSASRWLMPDELEDPDVKKGFGIGLHVPGTFDKVIDIRQCEIQKAEGNDILDTVRQFILGSGLPAYGLRSHEGFWRFLMLRHSVAFDQWMVNIVTKTENNEVMKQLADVLIQRFPNIESIVNNITEAKSGVAFGEYETLVYGSRVIKEKLGEFTFEISANSFFQTNTRACETLYGVVDAYAGLTGEEQVLDLYSGTGTIPIWLSGKAKQITGIEIVESAVLDAQKNASLNGIDNCRFLVGDIKDILPGLDGAVDVLIIDPPRAGMHKDVVSQVLALGVQRVVYVSCNPATLARDLELLSPLYHIHEVQPVDMFPHTYHIESVALLTRK